MNQADRARRIAAQHLHTSRLLGVDFIPVRPRTADCVEPASSGQTEAQPPPQIEILASSASVELFAGAGSEVAPPELSPDQKAAALEELRVRHETCPLCTTMPGITQLVFGEGDPDAKLMFVGEAPGEEEDRTGRPFVGRAGQKLDDIIKAMGLARQQVYIANVLKSRPPGNRTPLEHEMEQCGPFLAQQIRIIRPRVLVAMGNPAVKWLLKTTIGITRLRGQWAVYADGPLTIPIMPTFHPAFLLRQYTRENREKVWSDMQAVLAKLRESASNGAE